MRIFKKPKQKGWKNPPVVKRPKKQFRAGIARSTEADRMLLNELAPPLVRRGEYLYANCVVLAAAIIGPESRQWAEDLLPQARMLDWRRSQ
jgi:hypothetical protein